MGAETIDQMLLATQGDMANCVAGVVSGLLALAMVSKVTFAQQARYQRLYSNQNGPGGSFSYGTGSAGFHSGIQNSYPGSANPNPAGTPPFNDISNPPQGNPTSSSFPPGNFPQN